MVAEIGFAIVGLGMGKSHCRAVVGAPGARLVGVCDIDSERLGSTVAQYGCKGYANLSELLEDKEVEVVNVATPSGSHAEVGIAAAEAGKHLIVEKPADITLDRIDALIRAGQEHGVKISGIFQARFDALNLRVRSTIQSGRLGKIVGVHGHLPWYRAQSYYQGLHGAWKGTWDMDGGGSLMNQGVHTVDLLQWLVGPVVSVAGMFGVFGHEIEAEDQTVGLLRFANGALGTLYTTTCCYPGYTQRLTIYGTEGSIVKEEGELVSWKLQGDAGGEEEKEMLSMYGSGELDDRAADPLAVSFDGHTQIINDMIEALGANRDPIISLKSARHAVEIINGIYAAARSGEEQRLG